MDLPFPFPPPDARPGEPDDPMEAREQEVLDAIADAPDEPLAVRVVSRQGVPVVYVEGEVDIYTAGMLQERLREVISGTPRGVIVDLSRTQYLDSKGLGVLLQAARAAPGRLRVVSSRERISRLFRATGLDRAVPLHETLAGAVAALGLDDPK